MTGLTEQEKEFLFDYSLGLTSESESAKAQELIFSNKHAADFVAKIKASLSPLDSIGGEECPDELAEGTIWRLKQAARTSQVRLETLIAGEQSREPAPLTGWLEIARRLAVAALFVIVALGGISALRVGTRYAHQKYQQHQCAMQLARIFNGISNYKADNSDQMPTLASAAGSPWWKVGDQGPENNSNTRRMWLLVRNGYTRPEDFICSVRRVGAPALESFNIGSLHDFPSREYITYSFRITCPKAPAEDQGRRSILAADMNPIFENLPRPTDPFTVELREEMLKMNSRNHGGKGQNILMCDGSVGFNTDRRADISLDDIFTLQDTSGRVTTIYKGVELPSSDDDAFLAP